MSTSKQVRRWGMVALTFILFQLGLSAQSAGIFSIPFNGEEASVTQEINSAFFGQYNNKTIQYSISKRPGESVAVAVRNGQKEEIVWGVKVENEQPVTTQVTEFINGKSISYEAYVVIVYNTAKNTSEEWLLYELEGKKYFGTAEKIESVASNK